MLKVATWNVNSLRVRLPQLRDWLTAEQPDLLGLQETKVTDADFPRADIESLGYAVTFAGQKSYNGVAILSRQPATEILVDIPGFATEERRVLAATFGTVRMINLYVPNGSEVGSEKYDFKLRWLAALTLWLKSELAGHAHAVVVGDFNIAPDERDVHDPEVWKDGVLFNAAVRSAFQGLVDIGLCDTFRLHSQEGGQFSWWDYRMAAFRRNLGLRIDHVLASSHLCKTCTACRIDKAPRKLERPSDHTPVIAEFNL
ncbi:MAG: exodeoxyribonuclease III [Gammaproteobacteria bacterium]|nr:exodeoxyribonuclease III [Gammaproteobacteria bacterium]